MASRRITATLEGKPGSSVLIVLPDACDFDELKSIVEKRLGVVPTQLHVDTARVLDAADLREGDSVMVRWASPSGPSGPEPCSLLERQPTQPRWYPVLQALLTLVIFVVLSELFQRFVFRPWFQPTDDDASHRQWRDQVWN